MPWVKVSDEDAWSFESEEYQQLGWPEGAEWPRVSVRVYRSSVPWMPVLYVGRLWAAPGIPSLHEGHWVTTWCPDLGRVMDWAAAEVALRRPRPEADAA